MDERKLPTNFEYLVEVMEEMMDPNSKKRRLYERTWKTLSFVYEKREYEAKKLAEKWVFGICEKD